METAAAALQARLLMLCVCGTLIMLAAQGVPVLRKSGPTPQWPSKPVPHTYIPKRFQRIWAEKRDELLMEGPSGDGPVDAWDSPLLPGRTSEAQKTSDEYATRSPLPEDVFPSQSEPFPSIIDTEIESSESLREEFISRSSVHFHGPSSLLNTLIFRPSLPDEPQSSLIPTPTVSSSNFAQTSLYDLSASWTEMDEMASSHRMSSRRALSYSPAEVFAIITAVSATYIYQQDSEALTVNPSDVVSGYPFSSLPSNERSHPPERPPDQKSTSAFNSSVHLQNSDASLFDISSVTSISFESYDSVSEIKPSFSSNLFPVGVSEALTDGGSDFSSSIKFSVSTDEHALTTESSLFLFANLTNASFSLINPSLPLWNAYNASLSIHTSSLSTEAYFFSNNTLDSSFDQSLLLIQSTGMIPLLTPERTIFLSNVETTVTIIDNKDTPFTYVLPTLTVTGTTFSGTYGIFTNYIEDFSFIPSLGNEMEVTIFNDFSTFKHLSSSFDTFSTADSITGLKSTISHISMDNIITASSSIFRNNTDFLQFKSVSQFPKPFSSVITYSYFSTTGPITETSTSSEVPFKNYSVSETKSKPVLSVFSKTVVNKTEDFIEDYESPKTMMHEVQTKMKTSDLISFNEIEPHQQLTMNISAEYSPSPTLPYNIPTTMFEHNTTLPNISGLFESLTTSFHTEEHIDSSWKSTDILSNEVTKQGDESKSEEAAFIQSEYLQFSSSTTKDVISADSGNNFLDPFTHHITVRSLRDTSSFDISTLMPLDLSTSNGFDERSGTSDTREEFFKPKPVSNLHETEIASTLSSISPAHGKSEASIPNFVTISAEQEITAYASLFSDNVSDDLSSVISAKSEIYFLESSFIPLKTLNSEDLFHSQSTTYLSEQYFSSYNQKTILPINNSDFTESYTDVSATSPVPQKEIAASEAFSEPLKSIQTSINVYSLNSFLPIDFEVSENLKPSIMTSESSLKALEISTSSLLFTYNHLASVSPISVYEDNFQAHSQLDNHFLESSNTSSKALDGTLSLIIESDSEKIDLKYKSDDSSLLITKSSESDLNIFASDYYMTQTFPSSNIINLETASLGIDSPFELEEPKRSYFEFHESTRILEPDIKPLTPILFYSSDYVRSAIYDSFETGSDILKDFKVSSTLITDFYPTSLQNNLFSSLETESPSIFLPSKKMTFSSLAATEHSEIKSKTVYSAVEFLNVESSLSSEVVYFSQMQQTKTLDMISETEQVSLLSSVVESYFPEMSALDLSTYYHELSLLSKVSSPMESPDFFSTTFKQPRSMDSFLAKHETESYFSLFLSPLVLSTAESELSSLIISGIKELESISEPTRGVPNLTVTPLLSVSPLLSEFHQTEMFSLKHPLSLKSDYHEVQTSNLPLLSSEYVYTSVKTPMESLTSSSTKERSIRESYFPSPITTPIFSSMLTSRLPSSVSVFSSSVHLTSVESFLPELVLSPTISSSGPSERYPPNSSKIKEPLSVYSHHPQPMTSSFLKASASPSFETLFSAQSLSNVLSSYRIKDPISIESTQQEQHLTRILATPILSHLNSNYDTPPVYPKEEHKSLDSVPLQSRTYFTRTVSQTPILPHSYFQPHYDTPPVYPKGEPKSIDSMSPQSRTFFIRTVTRILDPSDSMKLLPTPSYTKIKEPQSIESDLPVRKVTSSPRSSDLMKLLPTPSYTKIKEPQSIESDLPAHKVSSSPGSPLHSQESFWSVKPQFDAISSTTLHRLESSISGIKPTSAIELSPSILRTEVSSTWLSTAPDSTDVVLVSVLPISSFLNVNQTKNSTGERSHLDESTDEIEAIPTRNTFLFKDNHYWILTVLESPAKGQLPENFSHILENRLANAYSDALRNWPDKGEDGKDVVVVKILSVTDDLLLRQLDIVYVVEKGGSLVPSAIAAEHLNSLRFEQLREFLGYHAIEKARPYRPPGGDVSRPVGSPLPVLAIVGGLLLALLLIFCCVCLYCRCCRPKPAPASPGSSASGSLQRSLSKYGQHNRKHLFREMTHQLTAEMAAQIKHGSTAPEAYRPEKTALSGRSLPTLPRESDHSEKKASMKRLKILENKEASTSPLPQSRGTEGAAQSSDTSSAEKRKPPPKPKKRRKVKESGDQASRNAAPDSVDRSKESPPPTPPPKRDVSIPTAGHSPDSGTSSRPPTSQPSSSSEKEAESEGSNTELLPPIQDLIDRSKSESEAAAAEAQMHLSRVRQRISEMLDDAFAMAGGRRLYGSLRSKKIEPTSEVLPRFGSFRSQSATDGEITIAKRQGSISIERRPISEGGQRLLGVLTDEGQLITHPPPKLVWDQDEGSPPEGIDRPLGSEVVEARNRNIHLFPFQPQRVHQLPALPSASSLPLLDTLPESRQDDPTRALREAASELCLPFSAGVNPATGDQYDELDVVSALRNGEPVEALIQAIKDELQRFAGSLPGDGESNA